MSDDNSKLKPGTRDAPATQSSGLTRNNSGRVKFDDRGNAVWEWTVATGSFGTDISTSRLKKLENQTLSLADETPEGRSIVILAKERFGLRALPAGAAGRSGPEQGRGRARGPARTAAKFARGRYFGAAKCEMRAKGSPDRA